MKGERTLKIPVMKVEQGIAGQKGEQTEGTVLYLTYLRAKDLAEGVTNVDAWSPNNKSGYQRMPVQARFRKIARYVLGKEGRRPILPQAIVLNRRVGDPKLKYSTEGGGPFGTLEVRDDQTLWEVDGQHRLGGLRVALEESPDFGDYPVPVVITEGLSKLEEAILFYDVNWNQKRVPTDLAQRLIEQQMRDPNLKMQIIGQGKDWIPRAVKVVDAMLDMPGHPWVGKIGIPGTKVAGVLTKQVSFVSSLKPIMMNSLYGSSSVEPSEIAQLLVRYWQAIESVCPEAFEDPDEYVIQKTTGIFPLHSIAPEVFEMVRTKHGKITKDALTEVMSELSRNLAKNGFPEGSDFWHGEEGEAAKYGSQKGFRMLADILRDYLPKGKKLQFV